MVEAHLVEPQILKEIGLMIVSATIMAHFARVVKQPLIIGYILAGIVIGPAGLRLITNDQVIRSFSELGIAFLLFIVGVELDLQRLRSVGVASTAVALINTVFMVAVGFILSYILGLSAIVGVYMGLVLSFSSTMIVIKLLSDKNELETLHGRIILGILLIEDVIAVLALSVLSTFEAGQPVSSLALETVFHALFLGAGLFSIALVAARFILPSLFAVISNHHELLFATALSVFFIFTGISNMIGFSVSVGAFMAGIAIATFPYNLEIEWRVKSLRDFFVILFFVSLGMEIWFGDIFGTLLFSLPFILVVLTLKPVLLMVTTSLFRYGRRISFLTGAGLAQISEFSMIVAMAGLSLGHITPQIFSVIAFIGVVSFAFTGYLIKYDNQLYKKVSERLWLLESMAHEDKTLSHCSDCMNNHAVLIGCHRMGYSIIKMFEDLGIEYIVMDFNPDIVKALAEDGRNALYGDVGDIDTVEKLQLESSDLVVSTIVDEEDSLFLLKEAKDRKENITVFLTADTVNHALELYDAGADYVLIPKILSGIITSELVEEHVREKDKIYGLRDSHIQELEEIAKEELLNRYEPSFIRHLEKRINGHFRRRHAGEKSIRIVIEEKDD